MNARTTPRANSPTESSFRPEYVLSTVGTPRRGAMQALPAFALATLVLVLVAAAGAFFPPGEWYAALAKPSFTPPDAVFGPAWAVLYAFNAVALGLVLKAPRGAARHAALVAMGVQLALNALWTPVFFGAQSPVGGVVVISLLLAAILFAIARTWRVHRVAAALLLPYLTWVGFASVLNLSIWMLNA